MQIFYYTNKITSNAFAHVIKYYSEFVYFFCFKFVVKRKLKILNNFVNRREVFTVSMSPMSFVQKLID